MPKNYFPYILLFLIQPIIAQQRVLVSGIVTAEGTTSKTISVINYNTKLIVQPKADGQFEIWAKKDDLLIFMLDDYLDQQITVGADELKNKINVRLKPKPIELDEVKIEQKPLKAFKVSQADLDKIKLQKDAARPIVQGVYTGETVNGVDFVRMGKGIINFFKKKDQDRKPKPAVDFKQYIKTNINEDFYTKTLKLKPEQVYAFIDYCNDDPMAKTVVQNNNSLAVVDFLLQKSKAFRKLD